MSSCLRSRVFGLLVLHVLPGLLVLSGCAAHLPPEPARRPSAWAAPEVLVPPSAFGGAHGLALDARGRLLVASVAGNAVWEVDRSSGEVRPHVAGPQGQADDVAVGPRGELAWTSVLMGILHYRESEQAPVRVLASGMRSINGVGFDPRDGRLYVSQTANTGPDDALWEIDRAGVAPPRLIARGIGSLNGFKVGQDGMLYGALMFRGQAARVDPRDGRVTVIAEGFGTPTAAAPDSRGNLWVVDSRSGELVCVELATGRRSRTVQLRPAIDNVAVSREGTVYVSNMADNAIHAYDPASGELRALVQGRLAVPSAMRAEGNSLYVADVFSLREVDVATGAVKDILRRQRDPSVLFPSGVGMSATRFALASWISGTVVVVDRASRQAIATLHGLRQPYDAIPLADGSLVVAEFGAGTLTHASGRDYATRRLLADGIGGPAQMLLVEHEQAIYLTEATGGKLTRVSLQDGGRTTVFAGLQQPEGLARTPWGTWVVAEAGARRIVEIDAASGQSRVVATDLPIGLPAFPGAPAPYMPTGVAVGADGAVYFASDLHNAIYRIPRRDS